MPGLVALSVADRYYPPRNEVRKQKRENAGHEEQKNGDKPYDGRIRVEHLADAGANSGNFLVC